MSPPQRRRRAPERLANRSAVDEIITVSSNSLTMPHLLSRPVLAIALVASPFTATLAQSARNAKTTPVAFDADSARLAELPWRSIGPAVTSGRVVDFAVPEGPA